MSDDPLGSFREQLVDGVRGEPRRRRRRRAVAGAAAAALVVAAAAVAVSARGSDDQHVTADGTPTTTTAPPAPCPRTRPPVPGLSAPDGWPAHPPSGVWYGTPGLWTQLPSDGSSPTHRKSVWWSADFPGGGEEEKPEVSVIWRRLDDPTSPPRRAESPGTNAYTPGTGWFMIASAMDPITIGCWEVTGSYKGHQLTYVFEVKPQLDVHPRPSDAGDGARLAGVVRYDARINCFRLDEHPVVWPTGTTVSDDGEVITLADGTQVHIGDHVSGGGGFSPSDQWARWSDSPACFDPGREIAIFNASGPIEVTR
jgi:hypothetical protein